MPLTLSSNTTLTISPDSDALALRAAQAFADAARESIAARGRFTVALGGGSTPEKTYRLLAAAPYDREVDWSRIYAFVGDERFVPADDPRSNIGMAVRTLISKVPIAPDHVFPVDTTLPTATEAALAYAETLKEVFGADVTADHGMPIFDLILLGLGDDGHTASLFPHAKALLESQASVVASPPGVLPPPVERVTLTFPAINAARAVLFLIAGTNKAEALTDILVHDPPIATRPAAGVIPFAGTLTFLVDEAAAAGLENKE